MNFRTSRRPYGPGTVRSVVSAAVLAILVVANGGAATYSVPRFSDTAVVNGLSGPTDFAFLPDGRILILEKAGRVLMTGPGGGTPTVAIDMTTTVDDGGERGLLGICIHPGFATNGYVFLYYTYTTGPRNRISRFTLAGSVISAATESVVLDNIEITPPASNHNGGTILIGPDGKLWAAPGDSGTGGAKAQIVAVGSPSRFNGKVLRMELDGSPAAGNPYLSDPTKEPRIWAYGLRNPFRFSFRPSNGSIYIGDVGQSSLEELDVGTTGGGFNFGWPHFEGTIQNSACPAGETCRPPIFEYGRTVGTTITGGVFVTGNAYPPLKDKYVFGDHGASWIRYLEFNGSDGLVGGLQNLATSAGGPVAFHQGPDGSLYYAAINVGRIYRIDYAREFHTVAPCRAVDTRDPAGSFGGPQLAAGADRTFVIGGRCGVPATARAVAVNLTVTDPTDHGHLTIYPAGVAPPTSSAINFRPGLTRANNAIVLLGPAGDLVVRCSMATGGVHFVLDVTGYTE